MEDELLDMVMEDRLNGGPYPDDPNDEGNYEFEPDVPFEQEAADFEQADEYFGHEDGGDFWGD